MDKIDIDGTGLNNVDWLQNGEEADESILNRPTKQISQFVNDLIDADVTLQSNIDTEKARIDAILDAAGADSDSFAEIVQIISNVDTENDQAFAAYVLSNDQAVSDIQSELGTKANSADVYLKTETYSQSEIDAAIAAGGGSGGEDPYIEYSIYETSAAVFADGAPGIEDAALRDGWYYENDGAGGFTKFNWYFYDGTSTNVQLSDFSAYAVMTFDDISNSPIFGVYTLPTGTNDAIPGFAHSRITYSVPDVTPVAGVRYLVYFGTEPNVHNELPRIQLTSDGIANVGEQDPSEIVLTVSLGSNSVAAPSTVKYLVRNMGVNTPTFKVDYELKIEHITKQEFASEVDTIITSTAYTKSEVDSSLALKANSADVYLKTETYSQTEVDTQLSTKANSADVYNKTEIDNALDLKADILDVDAALSLKANSADVYLKTETYSQAEVDAAIAAGGGGSSSAISQNDTNVTVTDTGTDGKIDFTIDGNLKWSVDNSGNLVPASDNTIDVGSATNRVRDLYVGLNSVKFVDDSQNEYPLSVSAGVLQFNGEAVGAGEVSQAELDEVSSYLPTDTVTTSDGNSVFFDGAGDYISSPNGIANDLGAGDFTVECWFKSNNGSLNQHAALIASYAGSVQGSWSLKASASTSGNVEFAYYDGTWLGLGTSTNIASDQQWHHVAVTRSNGTVNIWVDGTSVASSTINTDLTGDGHPLTVGFMPIDPPSYINGYISNARIISGVAVYTSSFTPPTSPLTVTPETQLLTANDTVIDDDSTNNLPLTINDNTVASNETPFTTTTTGYVSAIGDVGTKGDILYHDGTKFVKLAAGTTGQVLTMGASGIPEWQ
jgi:hypothetical protein